MVLDLVLVPSGTLLWLWTTPSHNMDLCLFNCGFHKSPTIPCTHQFHGAFARSIWIANASWIAKSFNPRPRRFEAGRPVPYQILASDDEKVLGHLKRLLVCKNH